MKSPAGKAIVLAIGFVLAVMVVVSCKEQDEPNEKKARFVAVENIKLKKQIENQKTLHNAELEKCLRKIEVLEEESQKKLEVQIDGVLMDVMKENVRLREENNRLKKQLERLEK